ncbi:MAG: prohibitin family protein [Desulfobulbus sp.]|nr:prohibitin family protein [Desulfobulbus sp.]
MTKKTEIVEIGGTENPGINIKKFMEKTMKYSAIIGIVVIVGIIIISGSWFSVNQGDRAIILRFGRVIDKTEPGFHFKVPFIDSIKTISVRTRKIHNKTEVYSKDIQVAQIALSLNYNINPASVIDIYSRYSTDYEDRVIIPQIMAKSKDVFGQFNAVEVVRSREKIAAKITEELKQQFTDTGIQIETTQIENIDYSKEYENSVEERMKAEVEVAKVQQNLEREKLNAEMVRTKARGEADAKVMSAEAEAQAIKLRGDAEASAIKAKASALAQNPSLVNLIQAERWNGELPQTMLPNGTVPIIGVKQARE